MHGNTVLVNKPLNVMDSDPEKSNGNGSNQENSTNPTSEKSSEDPVVSKQDSEKSPETHVISKEDPDVDEVSKKSGDENDSEAADNSAGSDKSLSKRQQKRLLKRQRWLETKSERRAIERARKKAKREEAKAAGKFELSYSAYRKRLKKSTMAGSTCRVGVVLDMGFDTLMEQKHLGKALKQMMHCYAINRRLENPMQFYITSFEGKCEVEMAKNYGYDKWDVHFSKQSYDKILDKDKLVYLTSESDNVVDQLESDKFYVIGGLVDHNAHKGLTHQLAVEKGIHHARLPINEFLDMKTRKVLTIDHVFQILARVSEGKSWKEAFLSVLPPRKGAEAKENEDDKVDKEGENGQREEEEECVEDKKAQEVDENLPVQTKKDNQVLKKTGKEETGKDDTEKAV